MREEEFYVALVKFVTKAVLDHTKNQSETLKIITVGVNSALYSHKKGKNKHNMSFQRLLKTMIIRQTARVNDVVWTKNKENKSSELFVAK